MQPEPDDHFAIEGASRAQAGTPTRELSQEIPGKDALLARVSGDVALLGAMAALFLGECPEYLASIRLAVTSRDAPALERAAHALRGSVSNFVADQAARAALRLELMGRSGDLTGSAQALLALEDELDHLRPLLEELT